MRPIYSRGPTWKLSRTQDLMRGVKSKKWKKGERKKRMTFVRKKSNIRFPIFEFHWGINFPFFGIRQFAKVRAQLTTMLAQGWGWNGYWVKEGTFLHLLEQNRVLLDQYFLSCKFLNLSLFQYSNGSWIKIQ